MVLPIGGSENTLQLFSTTNSLGHRHTPGFSPKHTIPTQDSMPHIQAVRTVQTRRQTEISGKSYSPKTISRLLAAQAARNVRNFATQHAPARRPHFQHAPQWGNRGPPTRTRPRISGKSYSHSPIRAKSDFLAGPSRETLKGCGISPQHPDRPPAPCALKPHHRRSKWHRPDQNRTFLEKVIAFPSSEPNSHFPRQKN